MLSGAKAWITNKVNVNESSPRVGVRRIPATAAVANPMAQAMDDTRPVFTPTSSARSGRSTLPRTRSPNGVNRITAARRSMVARLTPSMDSWSNPRRTSPNTGTDPWGNTAGRNSEVAPQMAEATP